jgi:hypothetical protein
VRVNGDAQPANLTNQQLAQLPVISLKQKKASVPDPSTSDALHTFV